MLDPQAEPLVVAKGNVGNQATTNWPAVEPLPVPERSSNYYCTWICCFIPLGVIAYVLGYAALAIAVVLAVLVYALLGCCLATVNCWFKTWDWSGGIYLNFLYLVYQAQLMAQAERPGTGPKEMPVSGLKPIPPNGELAKWNIDYAVDLKVPRATEEEFGGDETSTFGFLIEKYGCKLPQDSDSRDTFTDDEDPVQYVMDRLGTVYPVLYQQWRDKKSDEALVRFCLHGLGAHRVDSETIDGKKYFVVRTNTLSNLPVRDGFERYGGDAYFDESWRPAFIKDAGLAPQRRDGSAVPVITRPGDPEWPRAKFRFRSSLSVLVTFVDHLFGIHLQVSNLLVTACRENMEPDHPVRRFLVPYSYKAISVNDNAHFNLIQPGSFMSRCFAFTDHGMQIGFAAAKDLLTGGMEKELRENGGAFINKEKYYEYLKKEKGIETTYTINGAKYWRITRKFVSTYLECYYESSSAMLQDMPLVQFMRQIAYSNSIVDNITVMGDALARDMEAAVKRGNSGIRALLSSPSSQGYADTFRDQVIDVITMYIFMVTAGHEQVGTIGSYVQDVSFCAFKWTYGATVGTKQTSLAQAMLMSFTSLPMPSLLGADWTHLFPQRRAGPIAGAATPDEVFRVYQSELKALSQEIDEYNANSHRREFPWNQPVYIFNPKLLETAVNV